MSEQIPNEHAATVRDVRDALMEDCWSPDDIAKFDEVVALANRATQLERERAQLERKCAQLERERAKQEARGDAYLEDKLAIMARANELERERDDYRATNGAVRVCSIHTRDIVDGDDCLICSLDDAEASVEQLETALQQIVWQFDADVEGEYAPYYFVNIARAALTKEPS